MLLLTPVIELTIFLNRSHSTLLGASLEASGSRKNQKHSTLRGASLEASSGMDDGFEDQGGPAAAVPPAGGGGAGKGGGGAGAFAEGRRRIARGLIDESAEWLTGMLALVYELYRPWLDAVIQNHINGVSAWLHTDTCTVGGTPIVVGEIASRHKPEASIYLSIYLCDNLSIYLSIYLYIYIYIYIYMYT